MLDKSEDILNGLDRAQIHESPQIDVVTKARALSEIPRVGKRHLRRGFGRKLSALLRIHDSVDRKKNFRNAQWTTANDLPVVHAKEDAIAPVLAPNPSIDTKEMRLDHSIEDKSTMPSIQKLVFKPIATTKKWAFDQGGVEFAENMNMSAASHGASVNILRQEQKIDDAMTEDQALADAETLMQLKQLRQDEFVRWSLDRHVRKIGVVLDPGQRPQRPQRPLLFQTYRPDGGMKARWSAYGKLLLQYWLQQHAQLYLDTSPETEEADHALLMSSVQRLASASQKLQIFFTETGSICNWEDPIRTSAYMAGYFLLVFYNKVPSAAILYMLMSTVYKRWNPLSLHELRADIVIAENKDLTARHLDELITQHGTKEWMSHAIDKATPVLFDYCEHMADTLEMLQNAYEWRDPPRTRFTLCMLFVALIVVAMTPTWFLVKASYSLAGVSFFILKPFGDRFPRYKSLTSPITWLLWKVPTHVDWALARVQAEAKQQLLQTVDSGIDHSNNALCAAGRPQLPSVDVSNQADCQKLIGIYNCTSDGKIGRFQVTTSAISFTRPKSHDTVWRMLFSALQAIHKVSQPSSRNEAQGLLFIGLNDAHSHLIMDLERRDVVFTQIIGYSGLRWKKLG